MVTLLDTLEAKGIVSRRPSAGDRRRNVVELTRTGADVFARAEAVAKAAEHQFLTPVDSKNAARLLDALHAIVTAGPADLEVDHDDHLPQKVTK